MLRGKFLTDNYQNAINRVTFYKEKLVILFINSRWQDPLQIKTLVEELIVDNTEIKRKEKELPSEETASAESNEEFSDLKVNYYAIEVNDYYGWLLACKMGVYCVPTTLVIGPGPSGPRLFERLSNAIPKTGHIKDARVSGLLGDRRAMLKTPPAISDEIQRTKSLIEQQEEAYQRSLQTDLLRRRIIEKHEERSKRYEQLFEEWVIVGGAEGGWFKLAIILPDGQRVNGVVKRDAPVRVLFAIVRKFDRIDVKDEQNILIKCVDPQLTFKEDGDNLSSPLKDSGIYQLQKMYVEID